MKNLKESLKNEEKILFFTKHFYKSQKLWTPKKAKGIRNTKTKKILTFKKQKKKNPIT